MLSPPVQSSSLFCPYGPKLLPLPSVPDLPEFPARCNCPLKGLFGLTSLFLLFLSFLPSLKPRDMDSSPELGIQGSLCHLPFLPQPGGKHRCQSLKEKAEGEIKTQTGEEFSEATELGIKTCVMIQYHPDPTRLLRWGVLGWTPAMPGLPPTAAHPRAASHSDHTVLHVSASHHGVGELTGSWPGCVSHGQPPCSATASSSSPSSHPSSLSWPACGFASTFFCSQSHEFLGERNSPVSC